MSKITTTAVRSFAAMFSFFYRHPVIATIYLVFLFSGPVVNAISEEDKYGPIIDTKVVDSPYSDGLECASFTHKRGAVQLICFDSVPAKFGPFEWNAVAPAYYIENGVQYSM